MYAFTHGPERKHRHICLYMYAQSAIYQTVVEFKVVEFFFLIIKIASSDILFIVIYTQKNNDYDLI